MILLLIKSQTEEKDFKHIKKQLQFAPVWIAKIMRSLLVTIDKPKNVAQVLFPDWVFLPIV
jgi:hypothetical protein